MRHRWPRTQGGGRPTVCIDARYVRERASGIGAIVEQLVRRAPWIAPDLEFLLLKHPRARERLSDAPNVTERVVLWEANGPLTLLWLPRVVDLRGVDVFHAPFNILPAGLTMPSVATIHDLMWIKRPELVGAGPWGKVQARFYGHGIRRALAHADRIVAVSAATRAEIRSIDERAYKRTSVIRPALPNAFRRLEGPSGGAAIRHAREAWVRSADPYVLAVGQSSPYKNHDNSIRAFAKAFASHPNVKLVVIQRLGDDSRVRRVAREQGISDRVVFLREIPRSDLVALYNGAMALCHPSLWEGFGLPIVEAMACGCPVVTSPSGSMPEVAGSAAIYVRPEDPLSIASALARIAFEPGFADELRGRGLARVSEMTSWDDFAHAHVDLYRRMAGLARGKSRGANDRGRIAP